MSHCQILIKRVLPLLLAGALGVSWSASARAQNLLQNPNFEEPPHAPEDQSNVITDWIVGGTGDIHSGPPEEGATSPSYSAVFNVGNDSEGTILSQSFATTVGGVYKLEFDSGIFGVRTGDPLQLQVQIFGSGTLLNQTITPPYNGIFNPATFKRYTFTFTANSTTTTLQFKDIGLGNEQADTLVDTVSVVLLGTALITNGDFEVPPFNTDGTVTNWTVGGPGKVASNPEGATSGTHSAALNAGGSSQGNTLSQSFTTTVGQAYRVDFDSGVFGSPGSTLQLRIRVFGSGTLLDQTITPPVAGTFDPNEVTFEHYQFTFTANSATTTLQFSDIGLNNANADTLVDLVFVGPAPPPNLLDNPGFETGPTDTIGTVTDWTVGGNGNVASRSAEGSSAGNNAAVFSAGADSQGDTLSQTVNTSIGAIYLVEFDAGIYGFPDSGSTLQLRTQVFGSGTLLDETITPPPSNTNDPDAVFFEHYQFTFTANSTTTTLQFSNIGLGNSASDVLADTVSLALGPSAATPTISPNGGSFNDSVEVTLASATSGATIHYTINGSEPTTGSTQYTGPFTLNSSATVKAKAFKSGLNPSLTASASFTVTPTVATPTISPNGGSFTSSVQVTLACATSGATIYYTTNGSDPTTGSTEYTGPFTLNNSATVKAKAFKSGSNPSAIASANFTLTVATPTISPNGGNFNDSVQVTLACATSGATIYYTTNGSDPTTGSTEYSGPFTLNNSATVKAKAFKSGLNSSAIASANFTVTPTVATPTISPNGGSFNNSVQVTLACATSGATIRYTTNGSDPTAASTEYSTPFTLNNSATVKAKAFKSGFNDSAIASASFTLTVATPTISPNGGNFNDSVQVTLACATSGATIYYTTNGSDPTTGSTQYTAAFTLNNSATVKAKAFKSGFNDSAIASASFIVTPSGTVATPTISPNGGNFDDSVQVTLACATSGATIHYTTNGSDPTLGSIQYSGPFALTNSATVKARAFKSGLNPSAIAAASFTAQAGADFNADSSSDYLLFNPSNRKTAIWNLQGAAFLSSVYGPTLPSGWTVACVADIDRNGQPDYVLFNASTRQTAIWFLNGSTLAGSTSGPTLPAGWTLIASIDFDSDTKPDYVLFNPSTRQTAIWFLNGSTFVGSAYGPTLPAGWTLIHALDFNSNGKPDFLLSKPSTRQTAIWYLNNTVFVSSAYGPTPPSGWTLQGAADFNADAKPDYVLFEASTRRTAIWYLNGATFTGSAYGPTLAAGYNLVSP
jgi:hypothetical protein